LIELAPPHLYRISIFLPMNISIGGLTDAGKPHYGIIRLFYSVAMIYSIFFEKHGWGIRKEMLDIILMAGLGLCNFAIFLSPITLLFQGRKLHIIRSVRTVAAIYVCHHV